MPTTIEHPPVMPLTRFEFKTPLDEFEPVAKLKGIPVPAKALAVNATPLLGTWMNCDKQTGGLVKVVITPSGPAISVHAFGACVPTACDWGTVPGKVFADSVVSTPAVAFTALYKFNFKETTIVGRLEFGALIVETFDHFTDGSGRADYNAVYFMSK